MSEFERFWAAYPKRKGANPKAPAHIKWTKIVSTVDPEILIAAAKRYAEEAKEAIGTAYIAQTITWLNQARWEDYVPSNDPRPIEKVFVEVDSPQWEAWKTHRGKKPPETDVRVGGRIQRGWFFDSEWPNPNR